jgi:hypothetical protein
MPSARIRLDVDPTTKKRTIVISYESDTDALPHEHEEAHRQLLEKLFEKGVIAKGDTVKVEREGEAAPAQEETTGGERQGIKQGS